MSLIDPGTIFPIVEQTSDEQLKIVTKINSLVRDENAQDRRKEELEIRKVVVGKEQA